LEIEGKYSASDPARIETLQSKSELGDYRLIPLDDERFTDRYLDAADHVLRRKGYALRLRIQPEGTVATLKGLGSAESALHQREEEEQAVPPDASPERWPAGPVRDLVLEFSDSRPLRELFVIHQHRIKKQVRQGERIVGELCLDTVRIVSGGQETLGYEVEIEMKGQGSLEDIEAIGRILESCGLRPEPRSKYERGFALLESASSGSDALSSEERAELDRLAGHPDPAWARRAQMALFHAEGLSSPEISRQLGVSDSYVRRWLRKWRAERMDIFDPLFALSQNLADAAPEAGRPPETDAPGLSVEEVCARYAVDMDHARHVAAMTLALFDAFPDVHGLSAARRGLLETAALLHNVGMSVNPQKHHAAGRDVILSEPIRGVNPEERDMLACCARFHRKRVRPEKEPVFQRLSPDLQRETLALAALLRTGDAFDYSGSQTSNFVSLKSLQGVAQVVVEGRFAPEEAARAEVKADLWNEIFPSIFQALSQDQALNLRETAQETAPLSLAIPEERGEKSARPEATENAETSNETPKKKTPGVKADDTISEAGMKILGFHFVKMLENEDGTIEGSDPEFLHDMRVATRRMRSALRIFEPYLPAKRTRPLKKGLQAAGTALGAVRDLDVILEKARKFEEEHLGDSPGGFELLLKHWEQERRTLRKKMLDYLYSKGYRNFKSDFEAFLRIEDPLKGEDKKKSRGRLTPVPTQVRFVAPSLIWELFQQVRCYETVLAGAPIDTLHALRIDCKRFRYALEFFKETLGGPVGSLVKQVTGAQDRLGEIHDADVSANMARDFLKSRSNADGDPSGVRDYLNFEERELQNGIDAFPPLWEGLSRIEFRLRLGEALAAL
jgi:CHAD domain-containing protein